MTQVIKIILNSSCLSCYLSLNFYLMPYKPEAKAAAMAKYGFTSEPMTRVSNRHDLLPPDKTRNATVRLSTAHVNVVGAQAPSTNRL